jgi:hypothetical protein
MYEFNGGIFYDPETGNCYVGNGLDAVLVGELKKGLSPEEARQGILEALTDEEGQAADWWSKDGPAVNDQ